ncbi:MAG: DUF6119 family protein [Bacteroidota bacterium]
MKDQTHGFAFRNYRELLKPDHEVTEYRLTRRVPFQARLFMGQPVETLPSWIEFLRTGFGNFPDIPESATVSAVLFVRLPREEGICFAFAFGFGRHLVRPDVILKNFGLRLVINSVYAEQDTRSGGRVREIAAKSISDNTVHTIKQASRGTEFEAFGVDVSADVLRSITGRPIDTDGLGTIVSGGDAAGINPITSFRELGSLCERLERDYQSNRYQERFAWIDNVTFISDPGLITILEGLLIASLLDERRDKFTFALPDYVELGAIQHIEFTNTDDRFFDLDLAGFLDQLEADEVPLTMVVLKEHKAVVTLRDGGQQREWTVFECLTGEITYEERKILLEGSVFHEVAQEYLDRLDEFISEIDELTPEIDLPNSFFDIVDGKKKYQEEKEYNELAAVSANLLLLDRQNVVTIPSRTTSVEICDLLDHRGYFIHVKRELASSSLSHLFSQGFVSGSLLMTNPEFRTQAKKKLASVVKKRKFGLEESRNAMLTLIDDHRPGFEKFEIVFGIIDEWDLDLDEDLVDKLPFFSKVTLRTVTQALITMGFRVSYKRIPIDLNKELK